MVSHNKGVILALCKASRTFLEWRSLCAGWEILWALAPPNILPQSLWQRKRVMEGLVQQSDVVMTLVTLWTLVIWPLSNCNWMGKCNLSMSQGSIVEPEMGNTGKSPQLCSV